MANQTNPITSLLSQQVTGAVSNQLPSQQQVIQAYLGAIVAFWLIGGITLYVVAKATK